MRSCLPSVLSDQEQYEGVARPLPQPSKGSVLLHAALQDIYRWRIALLARTELSSICVCSWGRPVTRRRSGRTATGRTPIRASMRTPTPPRPEARPHHTDAPVDAGHQQQRNLRTRMHVYPASHMRHGGGKQVPHAAPEEQIHDHEHYDDPVAPRGSVARAGGDSRRGLGAGGVWRAGSRHPSIPTTRDYQRT